VGGHRADGDRCARRAVAPADRAAKDRAQCDRAWPLRHRFGLTLKTALIAHPVLHFPASGVTVTGFVELREESQHTDRFVLRVDRIDGGRIEEAPRRVRLSVKCGMAPAPGSFVEVKASLEPPPQPLETGSYDFARDLFFQGIGASGFVRGAVKVIAEPARQGVLARVDA
jgi:competence protein ComEC